MAVFDAILAPAQKVGTKIAALGTGTSSAEQLLGTEAIFAIVSDTAVHIAFGVTGMAAAATTDFLLPANSTHVFYMGKEFTAFRIFNDSGGNSNIYYITLSIF